MLLDDVGIDTGIDLDALLAAGPLLAELVGHDLPSRVAAAGGAVMSGSRDGHPSAAGPRQDDPALGSGSALRVGCSESRRGAVDAAGRRVDDDRAGRFATAPRLRRLRASCTRWSIADLDGFWAAVDRVHGRALDDAADRDARRRRRCPASAGSPARR